MSANCSISIIIPTCARAASVVSLLRRLFQLEVAHRHDIEIIVVQNDPRPDFRLRAVVEDLRAVYAHEPKPGQAAALNQGIRIAKGTIIAFIDDDVEISDPAWIDRLASHFHDPMIGYVAGNVVAARLETPAQKAWESKGGLSKGAVSRRFDHKFFSKPRIGGVPLRLIACGANSAIPKKVLVEVGLYDEKFGVGSAVGHSQSHEICYKILRAGYTAIYDPHARVSHNHPTSWSALRRRLYKYGVGDTAVHLHFFLKYRDFRSLREALFARHVYLISNLFRRLRRKYPLPSELILASLLGASIGPFVYSKAAIMAYLVSSDIGRKHSEAVSDE